MVDGRLSRLLMNDWRKSGSGQDVMRRVGGVAACYEY